MPSFLSKVFGRKKDEKSSSPARGRGSDGGSLLEGKFEVISPVTSGEFLENTWSRHIASGSGHSDIKSPSPNRSSGKDEFPRLPLSLPSSQDDRQARDLSIVFESSSEAQYLSDDVTVSDRRLTPLEALILVRICSQAIVARGLKTLGLMHPHWHSASPETQRRLISLFVRSLNTCSPQSSADSPSFSFFETEIDYTLSPHDVAAVLRWGLRHLELGPEGFGKDETWYRTFAEVERKGGYRPQSYSESLTPLIPTTHLELLDATLDLFSSLAAHSEENSISASKLTKAFGFWLLTAQRNRERDNWTNFYDGWQSSGRILEHVFLARIREQSLKTRMPTRLTELVARYPYVEAERMEDDIFLHPQLSTRQFDALLVRVDSEISAREYAHRHPLQLVKDALVAQVMSVDDNELVSFWERIQKSGNDESEANPRGYPGISRILDADTIRYLSLVPGSHPWKKSAFPTFNLKEVQDSPIFRRLASAPGSIENEGPSGSTNGHAKYNIAPASPSSAATSTSPSDWFQFSSAGFTDASASTLPLASTLFGQDVEKTNPPLYNKRPARLRSRSPSRARKSTERAASPLPPPVPDLPQQYSRKPIFRSTSVSLVKIDEAFIDFWVDALLETVSSNWPKFVLCKLNSDLPRLVANDQRIEYVIIEHVKGSISTPPQQAAAVPSTLSTPPISIPSTSVDHNNLERTTSPTKSLPSSPRSFKSEKRFFNLFSSSSPSGGSKTSGMYASATTSRGKKQKEVSKSVEERGVSEVGEVEKEKEKGKRSSTIVKLRMPSPRGRRSLDAPEQVRGRSTGEKGAEMERKERRVESKENKVKVTKDAEKENNAEGKTTEVVEEKKKEAQEKKAGDGDKEVEEKKKDSPSEIPTIATSAVAATAVAVAAVATSGSQQATSQEDVDITEDIRPVEQQTKGALAGQESIEETTSAANFEERPDHVLDTVIENPIATEQTPVLTSQTPSTTSQQQRDTTAEFTETGVIEDSAIEPPAPQNSESVIIKPIGKEELVSENVASEPVTAVTEDPILPQEDDAAAKPVIEQAAGEPVATEEHTAVEEPTPLTPPGLGPQIPEARTVEPEAVAAVSEAAEELAPEPVPVGTFPAAHPTVIELTPAAEESAEDADALTEEPIAVKASLAASEPMAAEELLIIEGPAAFDPSDIDAQVEEMNAQVPEESVDSEPTSEEEDSESVIDEECPPIEAEALSPIQETNEAEPNLAEDATEDIVEEPAVLEGSVEEMVVAPSTLPVAEEKDEVVHVIGRQEQVVQEEPIDEVVTVTRPSEEPVSPIVESSSIAVDEPHADKTSTTAVECTALEKSILEDAVEEAATIDAPTPEASSEPLIAAESAHVAEEFTIPNEEAVVEEVAPVVEEGHPAEEVVAGEDSATQVPAREVLVSHEFVPGAASSDERHATEELAVIDDEETAVPEQAVVGGVNDEACSSDVVSGDQPTVIEKATEAPNEEKLIDTQPPATESAPLVKEPEVIEEPAAQEEVDEPHPIEATTEPSAEELQAPATGTAIITEEDIMRVAEVEKSDIVDQPPVEDYPIETAKESVAGAPAAEEAPLVVEESPVVVEEPSVPQPGETVDKRDALERPTTPSLPVSEVTATETSALEGEVSPPVTEPTDITPVIDEDAIDAATPSTTAVVGGHEVTSIPDEPSASALDSRVEASNGSAEHVPVSGVVNGKGHHAIVSEKECPSKDDQRTSRQGYEPTSTDLPESIPVLVED